MAYDVYQSECPARAVLDHVGDKWALLVLHRLSEGPVRFNALRRDIHGLSQKVLSQVLKRLERDGLVSRTVIATVPVTVEFEPRDLLSKKMATLSILHNAPTGNEFALALDGLACPLGTDVAQLVIHRLPGGLIEITGCGIPFQAYAIQQSAAFSSAWEWIIGVKSSQFTINISS